MSYLMNNQQKINEVIFANRNKSYGAYAIRSAYGNTVVKSLSIMLFGFGVLMSVAFYLSNRNNMPDAKNNCGLTTANDSDIVVFVDIKQPEVPTQPHPPTTKSSASQQISTVISETESAVTNTVLPDNTGVGSGTTTDGPPSTGTTTVGPPNTTSISTPSTDVVVYVADSNPEYEGGLRALYAFLASKLKYPEDAAAAGKEGTVYVKFIVDQSGKVGNLSLLNNLGFGLDQEALRVVGMIPNFKTPGMMGGKPVRVYFQLPIKFKMD